MKNYSYTLSPTVKKELENLEITRSKMLLELVPLQVEVSLRFKALSEIISSSLFLSGKSVSPHEAALILIGKKAPGPRESVLQIKEAYDYLKYEWWLSDKEIDNNAIRKMLSIFDGEKIKDDSIAQALSFIVASREHPLVQTALCFIILLNEIDGNDSIKIASNISKLFAYKHGFDYRGIINVEEYFKKNFIMLKDLASSNEESISSFIEYFIQAYAISAESALDEIRKKNISVISLLSSLNQRQRKIMLLFDTPEAQITNKSVQEAFKVSQITASRDLSHLFNLGLVYKKGKGRSVYYTRG